MLTCTNHLRLLAKTKLATPSRCLRRHRSSSSAQTGRIVGPFKGFRCPSWSIEETLLSPKNQTRVTPADMKRLASLSYLNISESKLEGLTKDMDNILKSVAVMETVDTTNVEPLLSILEDFSLKSRPDIARSTTDNSEDGPIVTQTSQSIRDTNVEWGYVEQPDPKILDNASQKELGFFVVPKQKQPWEEDSVDTEGEDIAPLRAVQRKSSL